MVSGSARSLCDGIASRGEAGRGLAEGAIGTFHRSSAAPPTRRRRRRRRKRWTGSSADDGIPVSDVDAPRRSTSRRPASTPDHVHGHRPAAVRAAHAAGIELLDRPRHRYHRVGPELRAAAARGLGRPRRPCGAGRARGRRERRPGLRLGLVRLLRRSGRPTAGRSSSYPGPSPRKDDATARRAP